MLHSSIGIAMCPKDGKTPKEVVAAADAAMYRVKKAGKDDIAFYEERHSKQDVFSLIMLIKLQLTEQISCDSL